MNHPVIKTLITLAWIFFYCCIHEQEERDSADLEEIEQRNTLLREVHTYNRRYSGEARTLLEMIRFGEEIIFFF